MSQTQKLGKLATTVKHEEGMTIIRFYSTDIVTFDDRFITLNNGGYMTVTTKARMNQASNQFGLGYQVSQKNFNWYVITPKGKHIPFIGNTLKLVW